MEGTKTNKVNNQLYSELGERWYNAKDDPVALLRAEKRLLAPWLIDSISKEGLDLKSKVLDVGCGAGFLSNSLSISGYDVTAFDISAESLEIARLYDKTKKVNYLIADAYKFPFSDNSFDVVSAMDFLEHVDKPEVVILEVARVLKPNGIFFFSTFNKNWLAWLIVIKGVEWFVKNTPKNLHVLELFIKPEDLSNMLKKHKINVKEMLGIRPCFFTKAFLQMLLTGAVPDNFRFTFAKSLMIGYVGIAKKLS